MKKTMFLFVITTIFVYNKIPASSQRMNDRTQVINSAANRRSTNATPGRNAQGFSNNSRLNWRHPYMNR